MQLMDLSASASPPPPPRPGIVPDVPRARDRIRGKHVALFCGCVIWYAIARSLAVGTASGFALRFNLADEQPLLNALALLFLVALGISALRARERNLGPLPTSLGLPRRDTVLEEWAAGIALGWGIAAIAVLAMLLGGALHVQLWTAPRAFWLLALSAATLALATLAKVLALYGYGFQHLIDATGPVRATLVMIAIVAGDVILTGSPTGLPDGARLLQAALGALLLCLCWLRTRAVWLGWGAWFSWAASTALVFGLPLGAESSYPGVVDGRTIGPVWLTGGDYGPSSSAPMILLLIASIPLLMHLTDEFAWKYTRRQIVAAGIPVDIPAPAAHAAMEEPEPSGTSLVQIQPLAPIRGVRDAASD
jgi:hypothetical protein